VKTKKKKKKKQNKEKKKKKKKTATSIVREWITENGCSHTSSASMRA